MLWWSGLRKKWGLGEVEMPNWCENRLWVYGYGKEASKQAIAFLALTKTEKSDLVFNKLVPLDPDDVDAWDYDKAVEMWGTKWNPSDVVMVDKVLEEEYAVLEYSYLTAWSPPLNWLLVVSKKCPNLLFLSFFFEPGIGFMGVAKHQAGDEVIKEITWG